MLKKLANIISFVFHPLLMTSLLVVTLYFFAPTTLLPVQQNSIGYLLIIVLILTYILPLFSVGMLKATNTISSFKLDDRKERVMPFFFITVYYALTTYFFATKLVLGDDMIILFGSVTVTIFLITVITTFFKISAHTAGTAGVFGLLLAFHLKYLDSLLFWPIIVMLLLHGIVSSARLYLNTHDPLEVHLGAALGFVVNFGAIYLLT